MKNVDSMSWRSLLLTGIAVVSLQVLPVHGGEWDPYYDAERAAKDLLYSYYDEFRKLQVNETKALIQAIAEADEEDRKSVASSAGDAARKRVDAAFDQVERRKNESVALLDKAIANPLFKEKHSEAQKLKEQVLERWQSIEKMSKSVRGANHPVVAFMLEKGKEAHDYRQGRCTAKEFETGEGRADCIGYDGNSCLIIELKPDNQRAIRKGQDQVARYVKSISSNQSRRDELNSKSSSFASCKQFETRVDCYKLMPEVDNDGNYRDVSASWRTGCS